VGQVFYTVSIGGGEWQGGLGHVTADMIYKALPHPSSRTLILVHDSSPITTSFYTSESVDYKIAFHLVASNLGNCYSI